MQPSSVEGILGAPPGWSMKWGTLSFGLVTVILIFLGCLIHFPQTVRARISISWTPPPAPVVAGTDGVIDTIFVLDNAFAETGAPLAIVGSRGEYPSIVALNSIITVIERTLPGCLDELVLALPDGYYLGDLQEQYAQMLVQCRSYEALKYSSPHSSMMNAKAVEIGVLDSLTGVLTRQRLHYEEMLNLLGNRMSAASALREKGYVSQLDIDDIRRQVLDASKAADGIDAQVLSLHASVADANYRLADAAYQHQRDCDQAYLAMLNAIHGMKAAIANWEHMHLMRAPSSGRIAFSRIRPAGQFISTGETLLSIISASQCAVGYIHLSQSRTGEIDVGTPVSIHLDAYPYSEYGSIQGLVKTVSAIPEDTSYLVTVELPDSNCTMTGQHVEYKQGLIGDALIVTRRLGLLEALFHRVSAIAER